LHLQVYDKIANRPMSIMPAVDPCLLFCAWCLKLSVYFRDTVYS